MSHNDTIELLRKMGEKVDGTHAERIALLVIVEADEPLKMSDLAMQVGMSRGAVTSMVDRLVDQRLVKRVHSTQDRRVVTLEATAAGRKVIDYAAA